MPSAAPTAADRPRISVICTVRDEAAHVGAALAGILSTDVVEVVVVDDRSTDGTLAILSRLAKADPRVRVLCDAAPGRGPALDAAVRASTGEFVMNIDADDVVHPEWVGMSAAVLQASPALAVVASSPRYVHDHETVEWTRADAPVRVHDVTRQLAVFNPLTHSSAMMRRSALDSVGGYDPSRRTHVDYDLWVRLAAAGWALGTVDARLVAKRLHAGQKFERSGRLACLWASGATQARAIRAVKGGVPDWMALGGRVAWGLLLRSLSMGARRHRVLPHDTAVAVDQEGGRQHGVRASGRGAGFMTRFPQDAGTYGLEKLMSS